MIVFQKEFDDYDKMIEYLSKVTLVSKASFEFKIDKWVLNVVRFDKWNYY